MGRRTARVLASAASVSRWAWPNGSRSRSQKPFLGTGVKVPEDAFFHVEDGAAPGAVVGVVRVEEPFRVRPPLRVVEVEEDLFDDRVDKVAEPRQVRAPGVDVGFAGE